MASNIWLRTILIVRKETRCLHMGYSFRLAARVLLYTPSHRQDNTYHGLCYTTSGALAGTRNSSMGPPWRIDPTTHRTMSERSYHGATSLSTMKDRSDDPSHHERRNALTTELHLDPPWRIDPMTHRTMSERSYHGATSLSTMKDRSDDPSHHERTLLPRSYISLHHEGSIRRPIAPWANALTTELHLDPPWRIDPTTHRTMSERSYHGATSRSPEYTKSCYWTVSRDFVIGRDVLNLTFLVVCLAYLFSI